MHCLSSVKNTQKYKDYKANILIKNNHKYVKVVTTDCSYRFAS